MVGIGLLVYPDAADWFARRAHNSEISGYVDEVQKAPTGERKALLDAAYDYNAKLEPGPLSDPFLVPSTTEEKQSDVYRSYEQLLSISGSDSIGTLNYPAIDVTLPIYHGTTDETLERGVGHLYGSSLPVGGPTTHSVLTSHSGLPQAKLFTSLLQAKVGDTFWISVLGEQHYYRVESTQTVLPSDTQSLALVPGQDLVTLITCTPIGVNSHRFMVHAVRLPDEPVDAQTVIPGDGLDAGFPWWAVWFVGGSALVALVLFAPPRRRGPISRG
ncbi:class C sortase [Microbacterium sp. 2C]|uniref:class C sortase n=1 Tax=Microbacterium paulum TaxID=2707006 RepID=UPI0018C2E866|nr:class C sortase [Microbacterium paulum]MBG0718427.1 class C sortase [Microbacterium paulum]